MRERVWDRAGETSPAAAGHVIVDLDRVLMLARSEKQDVTTTWKPASPSGD